MRRQITFVTMMTGSPTRAERSFSIISTPDILGILLSVTIRSYFLGHQRRQPGGTIGDSINVVAGLNQHVNGELAGVKPTIHHQNALR